MSDEAAGHSSLVGGVEAAGSMSNEDRQSGEPLDGQTPGAVVSSVPDSFGQVQVWWGDGKGKTTAALGLAFRAAGHGYRGHVLQFMKGGAASVEDVRGEYHAIDTMPGLSYEHAGHYGWHGPLDRSDDEAHATAARAGLDRARELVRATKVADPEEPFELDAPPEAGVHLLVLDEIVYAANRDLVDPDAVVDLVQAKPAALELVLTGGHQKPAYLYDHADLVTEVRKEKHPFDAGVSARKGSEY